MKDIDINSENFQHMSDKLVLSEKTPTPMKMQRNIGVQHPGIASYREIAYER
jgi:hypothetical protein